jgi:hypothetical protein
VSKVQSESDLGNYFDYIFQIVGENLKPNPIKLFETPQVYLFIDKPLKIIWIWAGTKSRLFHRYIAANWAGKLKGRKDYQNFKYEVIKQGREPKSFTHIMNEINNGGNFNYPGESRSLEKVSTSVKPAPIIEATPSLARPIPTQYGTKTVIPRSERDKLNALIIEIKEINSHIKYSIEHSENRLKQIEQIIKKYS